MGRCLLGEPCFSFPKYHPVSCIYVCSYGQQFWNIWRRWLYLFSWPGLCGAWLWILGGLRFCIPHIRGGERCSNSRRSLALRLRLSRIDRAKKKVHELESSNEARSGSGNSLEKGIRMLTYDVKEASEKVTFVNREYIIWATTGD